jgi:predicted ATPase
MLETPLDSITVSGFRSIASVKSPPLRPINVIIGANGSGKSNFVGVFSFLHAIREGRLQEYVRRAGGAEQLLHFGSRTTSLIHLELSFGDGVNYYSLSLVPTDDDTLYPHDETAYYFDRSRYAARAARDLFPRESGREAGISDPEAQPIGAQPIARWVWHRLGLWRVYHMHDTSSDSPMRKTAQVNDNHFLRPDGANLPAFLYLLQRKHPESYRLIRATVQRVAPFFDDFLLQPDSLNTEAIRLAWKHKVSDQYFGASALSDGSLRFIALATLFLQPEALRPSVILVDEPELGLHPNAITLLAALAKQASVQTQVILSTQSSLLLDHFQPEDVLVADRVNDGTRLTRLDPERLAEWLEDYSLGQLWEKNEFGGRPGSE